MYSIRRHAAFPAWCFHIRRSPGQRLLATSPKLIAGCYVLHRLAVSRHPPSTLIRYLTTRITPLPDVGRETTHISRSSTYLPFKMLVTSHYAVVNVRVFTTAGK